MLLEFPMRMMRDLACHVAGSALVGRVGSVSLLTVFGLSQMGERTKAHQVLESQNPAV